MKVIFLDIDGVLNHEIFYRGLSKYERLKGRWASEIDRASVEILNGIIRQTGAVIVVSSTWRIAHSCEELELILGECGFFGKIIDKTPRLNFKDSIRGNEILAWMRANEELYGSYYYQFKNYVILDDDSDMLYWQRKNYIQTDRYCGLSEIDAQKAVRILCGAKDTENPMVKIEGLKAALKEIRSITNLRGCITKRLHQIANDALSSI
jgi:hypothetical protein